MEKSLHMQFSLMCLTVGVFTYLFFKFPFSLGGSFVLCIFIFSFIPIILKQKELTKPLGMLFLTLSGIIVLNYLAYWEAVNVVSIFYVVAFLVCLNWVSICFWLAIESIFRPQNQLSGEELKHLKSIRKTLATPMYSIGTAFPLISSLMMLFIYETDPQLYNSIPVLRISNVALAFFILAFITAHVYLKKISDRDIEELLLKEKYQFRSHASKVMKKRYLLIVSVLIIMGSGVELQRGMWLMWFETLMLLWLMSLMLWKLSKDCFSSKQEQ